MFHTAVRAILLFVLLPSSLLAVDIEGQVRLGIRKGLPKPATVQLVLERTVIYEQFTDLAGRFEFRGVGQNRYVVRARYEDLPEVEVAVDGMDGFNRVRAARYDLVVDTSRSTVGEAAARIAATVVGPPETALTGRGSAGGR